MNLHQTISLQTKNIAESIGYNDFPMVQTVIPTGELRKTCSLGSLYRWIEKNHHMNIDVYYSDIQKWCYTLRWCDGYGIETLMGEFLYIDSDSNFESEEFAFDMALQRAITEIKYILDEYNRPEKE